MILKSKICGVSDTKILSFIVNHDHPPQFVGFIVNYPKSKRHVDFKILKELMKIEKKNSFYVAVLVNPNQNILEEIKEMPTRSVSSVAATTAGVYKQDENSSVNVRGSRSDATDYYVDGMKVRGGLGVPQSGIEQITVITGGVPARYGDATGGIISVTTKGPSQKLFGGVEYVTSKIFDKYDYNLVGLSVSGPIWKKIEDDGSKGRSIIGYFISAEAEDISDTDPSAIGMWKLKDDVKEQLLANPFRVSEISTVGALGLLNNTDFLRNPLDEDGNPTENSDFELIQNKINNGRRSINVSGKLDFKPTMNLNLTLGGQYKTQENDYYMIWNSLMAWDKMPKQTSTNWRVFGRLTQKFGAQDEDDKESSSNIKNASKAEILPVHFETNKASSHTKGKAIDPDVVKLKKPIALCNLNRRLKCLSRRSFKPCLFF